jgi:hypothetical protein
LKRTCIGYVYLLSGHHGSMAIAVLELIRKYFEQTFKITDRDWVTFSSKLTRTEVSKRQLLLKAGETEIIFHLLEKSNAENLK